MAVTAVVIAEEAPRDRIPASASVKITGNEVVHGKTAGDAVQALSVHRFIALPAPT
jgi:hypothetical protein